jgi:hypothetical protein
MGAVGGCMGGVAGAHSNPLLCSPSPPDCPPTLREEPDANLGKSEPSVMASDSSSTPGMSPPNCSSTGVLSLCSASMAPAKPSMAQRPLTRCVWGGEGGGWAWVGVGAAAGRRWAVEQPMHLGKPGSHRARRACGREAHAATLLTSGADPPKANTSLIVSVSLGHTRTGGARLLLLLLVGAGSSAAAATRALAPRCSEGRTLPNAALRCPPTCVRSTDGCFTPNVHSR